jgi:dephospho-CoA kinase
MVVIGLTGGICSGKSTVSGFLAELGAVTLSADEIGHEAFQPHSATWQRVVDAFGTVILKDGDQIDRQRLGAIVFSDAEAIAQLNRIMHPAMHLVAKERIEALRHEGCDVVVLEAPLLVEANWLDLVDEVWVTAASESTVVKRCSSRSGLSEGEARERISSQLTSEDRVRYADVVVDTDMPLDEVRKRVKEVWEQPRCQEPTKVAIRRALSARGKKVHQGKGLTPAAVLIPLYHEAGECYLVLTKRTETVNHHKGQISFPGGTWQPEDRSLMHTALRECWEEIGLQASDVQILGEMDDTATHITNFVITPFVGAIPRPHHFTPDPREVEEVICVPLKVLLDKGNFREEMELIGDEEVPQYFYHYGDRVIWGATARILKQFLETAFHA